MHKEITLAFPDTPNGHALHSVLLLALANKDFMDDTKKIKKAVEILTPKSTLTATFKRLQGNALSDYSVNKEKGIVGYNNSTKASKMQEYVYDRFKSYMADPKTAAEATKLFNDAYTQKAVTQAHSPEAVAQLEPQLEGFQEQELKQEQEQELKQEQEQELKQEQEQELTNIKNE